METKITLDMSLAEAVVAMSEGNPGALRACMELLEQGDLVDPSAAVGGGFSSLLLCDSLGLYGSRLYMLWHDVCDEDAAKTIALLRAEQLGQLAGVNQETLAHAIDNRGEGIDVDAAVGAVKQRLPNFNLGATTA